jgi:uncharacterized protein DUF4386
MRSIRSKARLAGILYVVMSILMVFSYMYVPSQFIVTGDPAATAQKILDGAFMYRVTVLTGLISQLLFIAVVLLLYDLFREVDPVPARLMVALVCAGAVGEIVVVANRLAPFLLLSGDRFTSVFTRPQLEAFSYGLLRWGGNLSRLISSIWGLWLIPFGILVIRSGFFPKLLGYLLFAAGLGYMVTCAAWIVVPDQLGAISRVMSPLYFGELPIVLWMAILGARAPRNAPA